MHQIILNKIKFYPKKQDFLLENSSINNLTKIMRRDPFMEFNCPKEKMEVPEKASLEELSDYIELEYWQTLEEICAQEAIQPSELPELVKGYVKNIFDKLGTINDTKKEFLLIFKLYHALQEYNGNDDNIKEIKEIFSSYENFKSKFQSYFDGFGNANEFHSKLNSFYSSVEPRGMIMIENYYYPNKDNIYKPKMIIDKDEGKEQWIKEKEIKDQGSFYISKNVSDELNDISQNNFHHSTNSAALEGIANQKGLLSRSLLREKEENVVSGEACDMSPRVYVSESINYGKQYSFVSWFNEFSVDIEISREKAKEFQEDYTPDHGISLGHEVPIECFSRIFVSSKNIEKVKKWSEINCPWVEVYSREAFKCKQGL